MAILLFAVYFVNLKKKSVLISTWCLINFIIYKLNKISLEEYKEALLLAAHRVKKILT